MFIKDDLAGIGGTATCSYCSSSFLASSVYEGAFDFAESDFRIRAMASEQGNMHFDTTSKRWYYCGQLVKLRSDGDHSDSDMVWSKLEPLFDSYADRTSSNVLGCISLVLTFIVPLIAAVVFLRFLFASGEEVGVLFSLFLFFFVYIISFIALYAIIYRPIDLIINIWTAFNVRRAIKPIKDEHNKCAIDLAVLLKVRKKDAHPESLQNFCQYVLKIPKEIIPSY